jgi:hypothetical protein
MLFMYSAAWLGVPERAEMIVFPLDADAAPA